MIYGLSIAVIVGIPLAVAMARVRRLDWALDLPINALYATPLVALVPILVLWFGIYLKAKIIVVFLFAVFPILINTYQGVRECDKNMIEVARSFRSTEWRMWQDVLLPFALPYIAAGVRLAIGRGLVGMIIAEFYTTISGLGFMITRYANMFEMDKTFVPVIVLMILGVSLTTGLKWVGGGWRRGAAPIIERCCRLGGRLFAFFDGRSTDALSHYGTHGANGRPIPCGIENADSALVGPLTDTWCPAQYRRTVCPLSDILRIGAQAFNPFSSAAGADSGALVTMLRFLAPIRRGLGETTWMPDQSPLRANGILRNLSGKTLATIEPHLRKVKLAKRRHIA